MLKDQRQRFLILLDSFEADTAYPSENSDNESIISGDSGIEFSIDTVLGDLQTFVECLVSLGFSLQRPACDPTFHLGKTVGPPPSVTGSATEMRVLKMPSAENLSSALRPGRMYNLSILEEKLRLADAALSADVVSPFIKEKIVLSLPEADVVSPHIKEKMRLDEDAVWSPYISLELDTNASSELHDDKVRAAEVNTQLKPRRTRKTMSQPVKRALQRPFTSKKVEKHIGNLERLEQTYILALQADQT